MYKMENQPQDLGDVRDDDAIEREEGDLVVARGVFYRVLRPEEVPFWMRQDAEQHMGLLSTFLNIPVEPIEWFVPALFGEVPRQLAAHVIDVLEHAPYKTWIVFRSDEYCTPPVVDPVYFWRNVNVLGMAATASSVPGIQLRADMERKGRDGLNFVIAHEMKHRQQTYRCAAENRPQGRQRDREREANQFARWYTKSVFMLSGEFAIVCPNCGGVLRVDAGSAETTGLHTSGCDPIGRAA